MVDPQISTAFRPYLAPGERVVWTGRPAGGLLLTGNDWFLVPFSLAWSVMALYSLSSLLLSKPTLMSLVFGTVFGLAALFFVAGRFVTDAWIRSRTVYAVTTTRALEIRAAFTQKLITAPVGGSVILKHGRAGRGTLTFQRAGGDGGFSAIFGRRGNWQLWLPGVTDNVSFLAIDDPMEAYRFASAAPAP
ncbi:hypothetical protein [Phenylobacterium sp.]|uniref:hypothetical protein n=1 Tax=Phenylobacterium sp. TaxID=1871053 RepID=UPI00120345B8|nr:hypothetical protein [Phenylobacterium sp.]THD61681.1 MAG: hypothetical protein E8A12_09960 [Phenylobacterium sp.]